jgi:hypothetical protein
MRKSVGKFDAVPACPAAPPVTLDQRHRLSRTPRSFLRAARVFLSGLVDSSPFREVSLRREASILFTCNGPLVYRWEADKWRLTGRRGSLKFMKFLSRAQLNQHPQERSWKQRNRRFQS